MIGFRFRLYTVPDDLYGAFNPETREWNGIVRQLIDKRADLVKLKISLIILLLAKSSILTIYFLKVLIYQIFSQ